MKRKRLARVSSQLPCEDDGLLLVFVRRLVLLKRRFWRRLGFRGAFLRRLLGIVSVTPPAPRADSAAPPTASRVAAGTGKPRELAAMASHKRFRIVTMLGATPRSRARGA